jgi:hypothetical protein
MGASMAVSKIFTDTNNFQQYKLEKSISSQKFNNKIKIIVSNIYQKYLLNTEYDNIRKSRKSIVFVKRENNDYYYNFGRYSLEFLPSFNYKIEIKIIYNDNNFINKAYNLDNPLEIIKQFFNFSDYGLEECKINKLAAVNILGRFIPKKDSKKNIATFKLITQHYLLLKSAELIIPIDVSPDFYSNIISHVN